jgi:hypothetical protein
MLVSWKRLAIPQPAVTEGSPLEPPLPRPRGIPIVLLSLFEYVHNYIQYSSDNGKLERISSQENVQRRG